MFDIIKLGGSIITDKHEYKQLNTEILRDVCKVIATWNKKVIIVHGAGSFGHILAKKHSIISGYTDSSQLEGLTDIRIDVNELSQSIVKTLKENGVNAIGFQTSALVFDEKEEINPSLFLDPIKKALNIGLIPVLSGDVLFTNEKDFTIYSGDSLINLLVQEFDVDRVIFITDVDGLMVKHSKQEGIEILNSLNLSELREIELANYSKRDLDDVTGEMKGKVETILLIGQSVNQVIVVNGKDSERISKVLKKEPTICTIIEGEKSTKR
jgi:isopentenyl phosphate kinase